MPLSNGTYGFDQNDPNMDSQAQPQQAVDANTEAFRTAGDAIKNNPAVIQWMVQHGAGQRDLTPEELKEEYQLIRSQGLDVPQGAALSKKGGIDLPGISKTPWLALAAAAAIPFAAAGASALAGVGAGAAAPGTYGSLAGGTAAASGGAAVPALASGIPSAIGGASALGAAVPAAASAVPALASGIPSAITGGSTMSAPASTGGGFGSFVSSLFGGPSGLVSTGLNLAGTLLNRSDQQKAIDAQLQSQKDALATQLAMYNQQTAAKTATYNNTQANLAPYQSLGKGAASLAGYGLGIPGYETGNKSIVSPPPSQQINVAPMSVPNVPANTSGGVTVTGNGATPAAPSMVTMKAPTGQVSQVPSDQVQHYQQMGAQVVQGASA